MYLRKKTLLDQFRQFERDPDSARSIKNKIRFKNMSDARKQFVIRRWLR